MQYLLLVYADPALVEKLSADGGFEPAMRECLHKADAMEKEGTLVAYQQLEPPAQAKSIRARGGKTTILDGPFAETKEVLAGFNLIEADSMAEALEIAQQFPWTKYGCIEVRPVHDIAAMRRRVGA